MKVLVIGVDETTRSFLKRSGIEVAFEDLADVEEVHDWVRDSAYDAVLVDLDTAKWGNIAVRYLRSRKLMIPFVGISRGSEGAWSEHRATFLENGGDDLLHSPANPRELAASLRTVARRNNGLALDIVEFTHESAVLRVNLSLQRVTVDGIQPHLTGKEIGLICLLAGARNRVLSKEAILNGLYEGRDEPELKIIDVFICKLRRKLDELHPGACAFIRTVWGRGYQIESGTKVAEEVSVAV